MRTSTQLARFAPSLAVVCAGLASSGTASALTCVGNLVMAPADGETNVPTNTRLWAHGRFFGAGAARLVGPDGGVPLVERFYPVAITGGEATHFPISTPVSELEPYTQYRVEWDYLRDEELGGAVSTEGITFTTGEGPARDAPPPPEVISRATHAGAGWQGGVNRSVTLRVVHQGILIADNFVEGDLERLGSDLDSAGALGTVRSIEDVLLPEGTVFGGFSTSHLSAVIRWMTGGPELVAGVGDCGIWPEIDVDRVGVRLAAMDLAGNFSGWKADVLEIPSRAEASDLVAEREAAAQQRSSGEQAMAIEAEAMWVQTPAAREVELEEHGGMDLQQREDPGRDNGIACSVGGIAPMRRGPVVPMAWVAAGLALVFARRGRAGRESGAH